MNPTYDDTGQVALVTGAASGMGWRPHRLSPRRAPRSSSPTSTRTPCTARSTTAGLNPVALVDAINAAQAELEAAQAEQARMPEAKTISGAEVYAMIDYLGDVGAALKREDPGELQRLHEALNLKIIYYAEAKVVEGTVRPGRDSERVRGRSRTLTLRLDVWLLLDA